MSRADHHVPGRLAGTLSVLRRNLWVWRQAPWASLAGDIVEPVLYLLALGYGLGALVPDVQGMSYIRFLAPGLVVTACLYAASFEATYGTFTRMVPQGTFDAMLAAPIGVSEIVLGEVLFATTKALLAGGCVLAVVAALGLIDSPLVLLVPAVCLLAGLAFASLAILVSCLSPTCDFFTYYFTLAVTPMLLFSGVFFPLDTLPAWARTVAWVNPLTHATSAAHLLLAGRLTETLAWNLACLAACALLPLWPAMRSMRRRLVR
jgi:lipooligosaccharide transport system permease protein